MHITEMNGLRTITFTEEEFKKLWWGLVRFNDLLEGDEADYPEPAFTALSMANAAMDLMDTPASSCG